MLAFIAAGAVLAAPVVVSGYIGRLLFGLGLVSREIRKKQVDDELKNKKWVIKLGINPTRIEHAESQQEEMKRRLIKELGEDAVKQSPLKRIMPFNGFVRFDLDKASLSPKLAWIAGTYVLNEEERRHLQVGIRSLELRNKEGRYAERLQAICERQGIEYDSLSFLWGERGTADFEWFKRQSQLRLEDTKFIEQLDQSKNA